MAPANHQSLQTRLRELAAAVSPVFETREGRGSDDGEVLLLEGALQVGPTEAYDRLRDLLLPRGLQPVPQEVPAGLTRLALLPLETAEQVARRERTGVNGLRDVSLPVLSAVLWALRYPLITASVASGPTLVCLAWTRGRLLPINPSLWPAIIAVLAGAWLAGRR